MARCTHVDPIQVFEFPESVDDRNDYLDAEARFASR
jgi:hypothetical protein